eukprot:3022571-Pyramimonas_sp.AAC.1
MTCPKTRPTALSEDLASKSLTAEQKYSQTNNLSMISTLGLSWGVPKDIPQRTRTTADSTHTCSEEAPAGSCSKVRGFASDFKISNF